jgi:hypothetical protein
MFAEYRAVRAINCLRTHQRKRYVFHIAFSIDGVTRPNWKLVFALYRQLRWRSKIVRSLSKFAGPHHGRVDGRGWQSFPMCAGSPSKTRISITRFKARVAGP